MNEMIERVAKAIAFTTLNEKGKKECDFNRDFGYIEKCTFIDQAKAAIQAMREPTKEMLNEVSNLHSARGTWKRMIDAALEE